MDTIKNRIKISLKLLPDVYIFIAIVFIKLISLNIVLKVLNQSTIYSIIGILGSAFLFASFLCLFKFRVRIIAFYIIDLIISLVILTDVVYNRYFLDVTSAALIKQAGLVGEVKDSVNALFKPWDLLYFIDFIVVAVLYKKIKDKIVEDELKLARRFTSFALFIIFAFTFNYQSVKALEKRQPGILKTMYDKKYIVSNIGSINFHIFDLYSYITRNVLKIKDIDEIEAENTLNWFEEKNSNRALKYFGQYKGKNLIVVQLEAFQGFVLNRKLNGVEITPNLNKLAKNSLVFENYYYQTAWGGTSDAEFLSNVSLLPAREGSVYYQYAGNLYDSLAKELKGQGYFTSVMHANRPGFWNRTNMYKALGFDDYESEQNFNIDEIQGMGLSDKSFFIQAVEKMKGFNNPFYSFLITLSSHFPYKDYQNKIADIMDVGEFEGDTVGDYLKAVKYTDVAIGTFIEELKKSGLWDNSIVVFYGDHAAIPYEKKNKLAKLLYGKNDLSTFEWVTNQKVVMMIHFPDEKIKGVDKSTAGQMDLYPTLANLYGLEPKYMLGRDLLNNNEGFILTRDGNFADNNYVYLKAEDKLVEIKSGKEVDKSKHQDLFERYKTYTDKSNKMIEYDLLNYKTDDEK
ncbi:Lipoteichoic acid synthase 1 [Caloramator mitchellensis]|uniref:Lipoteichoic acid synthase 1 n=1 Tax=Caloramator mitchellensis TaxID=908809 RepID=A0A0R3JWJ4_CALMK|nr:LTA synthase family protein [Caloramator mitchellensis]KRQ87905.1 Lipoteichoic acid synthase 1 [Caloramator mitchellensis]